MRKKLIFTICCLAAVAIFPAWAKDKQSTRIGMIHCCIEQDTFMWSIANNIRAAAEKDGSTIIFKNAEGNQNAQLKALEELQEQDIDVLLMSIVIDNTLEKPFQKKLIEALRESNIPVVFYLLAVEDRFMQSYNQAYRVGSIPAQSGILQGEMISEQWASHPEWDRNRDGVMQYAILKGPAGNPDAEGRTQWVRATLSTFPTHEMKVEEIDLKTANWDRKQAREIMSDWMRDGTAGNIEVLIANNDDMLLGARDALASSNLTPALFGIDALPEVLDLIRAGAVAGTVLQDTKSQAENAYKLAATIAKGQNIDTEIDIPIVRQELIIPYIPVTRANANDIQ